MKIKFLLPGIFLFLLTVSCHQSKKTNSGLNLSFEIVENGMPKDWLIHPQPGNSVSLDAKNVKSGKYSIAIESTGDSVGFQLVFFHFPNLYDGKKLLYQDI